MIRKTIGMNRIITSAESGIATFRTEHNSLWKKFDVNKMCNILTFRQFKGEICEFYNSFRSMIEKSEPNRFHKSVKLWQVLFFPSTILQKVENVFSCFPP